MSVAPSDGRTFLSPILGILTADEQSKVPAVVIRSIVGMSAFAPVNFGEYPAFTPISTTCFPSTTDTLLTEGATCCALLPREKKTAPPISIPTNIIDMTVEFIILEAKDRGNYSYRHQAVDKIEECKHDDNKSCAFEEYSRFRTFLHTKRAKADKRKYGECAKCEHKHSESSSKEVPCRKRVDLHRLCEATGQEERGNTDQ